MGRQQHKQMNASFCSQHSQMEAATTGEQHQFSCVTRASKTTMAANNIRGASENSFSLVPPIGSPVTDAEAKTDANANANANHQQKQKQTRRMRQAKGREEVSGGARTRINLGLKNLNFMHKLFQLMLVNIALTQLNYFIAPQQPQQVLSVFPRILMAEAIECTLDGDCGNREKICHENKCICARDRPIEDQDRCLSLSLINEQCALSEQCLGNSLCVDGICSCGNEAISLYNPSSRIFYCHPRRQLNEECNHDSQCPPNSYCSTNKYGCICQNGFNAATTINNLGSDSSECLPKFCTNSSSCESEFHLCDDNKCKCLATHFDPTTGKCYKFGSTGGKNLEELLDGQDNNNNNNNNNVTQKASVSEDKFYSIVKDLMENSDRMWLVLIVLIALSILIFALIFMLIRRHYLGYCWTAHKKEYEPNNKTQPKNTNYFNKNSINNKSFRQKNGEIEDEQDDLAEDRSNLVASNDSKNKSKKNGNSSRAPFMTNTQVNNEQDYVKVNINDNNLQNTEDYPSNNKKQNFNHHQVDPLASSTSTPV